MHATLPKTVRPQLYNIQLEPDFETFTYQGYETILLHVQEPTDLIVLNSKCINISSAKVTLNSDEECEATAVSFDEQKETASIHLPKKLKSNASVTIHLAFNGSLNDDLCGFYRSRLRSKSGGRVEYMAVTHFEASNARRAFPCWDEPALKASFIISLVVGHSMVALSNMHVIQESLSPSPFAQSHLDPKVARDAADQKKIVVFAPTPLMSTYLVAFAVGDFEYIEAYTESLADVPTTEMNPPTSTHSLSNQHSRGSAASSSPTNSSDARKPIRCRVYCPREKTQHGRHALQVAIKALCFFEDAFGEKYPLEKFDMLSVVDYEIGAMENWGLVTFREMSLLFDEENGQMARKERIAGTVCHEIAHMWFGNLVTMEWWQDLWLKEGFATWAGNTAVDHIFPEWGVWTSFVTDDTESGMKLDALKSTHPIEVPVHSPAEVTQIFDAISYSKGASVIRMLSDWLGPSKFLEGIKIYMKTHRFGNATTDDLWHALGQATEVDVSSFMKKWTQQPGFPVLLVEEVYSGYSLKLNIRQERFLSAGPLDLTNKALWSIPLNLVGLSESSDFHPSQTSIIMDCEEAMFDVPNDAPTYLLNKSRSGFYRVRYSGEAYSRLAKLLEEGKIVDPIDRVGLLLDAGSLAKAGYISAADVLELCGRFTNEPEYTVWCEISEQLDAIANVWFDYEERVRKPLDGLRRKLFKAQVDRLGWHYEEGEHHLTTRLRTLVLAEAGYAKDDSVLKEAQTLFWKYLSGDTECMYKDIRSPVFKMTVRHGGEAEFEAMFDLFRRSGNPDVRFNALSALAFSSEPHLIDRALALLNSGEVGPSELAYLYPGLTSTAIGRRKFWAYVKENWTKIQTRLSSTRALLAGLIRAATEFASEDDALDVEGFFADKDTADFDRRLKQLLEGIRVSAAARARDTEKVVEWLSKLVDAS